MPFDDPIDLSRYDTGRLRGELIELDRLASGFGRSMTRALEGATVRGRGFGDVLRGLALDLSGLALKAAFQPLQQGLGGFLSGALGKIMPFAKGGVVPFASGGVVAAPTYFPMSGGRTGLMGEAGAEAIMPLARGPDGRLGVRGGGASAPTSVTVNIATPDVEGFRRSEAQISAALARAVSRGRRGL